MVATTYIKVVSYYETPGMWFCEYLNPTRYLILFGIHTEHLVSSLSKNNRIRTSETTAVL